MAILTTTETRSVWRALWAERPAKLTWAGATLPSLPKIHDAVQALETRIENSRSTLKADIDGALGITTTAAQARWLIIAFFLWKAAKMRGE
jgi:hypothetical protein